MIVELQGVWKAYGQGEALLWALRGVDLTLEAGASLAITGPSGSGKSTLLHLMGCLDKPSRGSVRIDGEPTETLSDGKLSWIRRHKIGFVFQQFYLNESLTALHNVLLPLEMAKAKNRKEKAREALAWVGLEEKANSYPSQLSGGEQQRVAIARALVNSPQLVLADEPTGNLDSETTGKILALLSRLNVERNVGLVLVTHDETVADSARQRIRIRDGRIVCREKLSG